MDIKSGNGWPSSALSNFAPHPFEFRGFQIASMEGLLQSSKFKPKEMQAHIFTLVGKAAKYAGKKKNWQETQTLWWQGEPMKRDSQEYQDFLDEAYEALSKNDSFKRALLATQDAVLEHSIGRSKENETVLTRREFCSRLMKLREKLKQEQLDEIDKVLK